MAAKTLVATRELTLEALEDVLAEARSRFEWHAAVLEVSPAQERLAHQLVGSDQPYESVYVNGQCVSSRMRIRVVPGCGEHDWRVCAE